MGEQPTEWTLRPMRYKNEDLTDMSRLRVALQAITEIRADPYAGEQMKPLRSHQVHERSLEDCYVWKLASEDYDAELRIVYRIHEDDHSIEIIAVGPRQASKVYQDAMRRLVEREELPRWTRFTHGRR